MIEFNDVVKFKELSPLCWIGQLPPVKYYSCRCSSNGVAVLYSQIFPR